MAVMLEVPSVAIAPSLEEQVHALQTAVLGLALWGCSLAALVGQMWQADRITEREIEHLVWKCRLTEVEAARIMLAPRAQEALSFSVPVAQDEIEIMAPDIALADMAAL